jgi:hypothetical protein
MQRLSSGIILLFLLVAGCSNPSPEVAQTSPDDVPDPGELIESDDGPDPANIVSGVGTIVYMDLEGGFYGLVADDGTKYNPLNLEETFKQDSLRVRFRGEKKTDVMTTRMWGTNLQILEMLTLD